MRVAWVRERRPVGEGSREACAMSWSISLEKVDEVAEADGGLVELRAEGSARRHVAGEGLAEGDHRPPPLLGQGRATPRSISKATLA